VSRRLGLYSAAGCALLGLLVAPPLVARAGAAPPPRFLGQGTTYWDYLGNDGNGSLTVKFDTTEPGLAANQADVVYAFDSGTQPFFLNGGQVVVTGDWSTGWDAVIASPPSHIHIGPAGTGPISFQIDGWLVVQDAGTAQGPWEVVGSFSPTQAF
jgi:hypothetical protein